MPRLSLNDVTRVYMTVAYISSAGNKSNAAKSLGISRTTFNKKFSDLDIMTMVEDVAAFHQAAGTDIPTSIKLDAKSMTLVLYLLEGELREVVAGYNAGDLANLCNELLDLIYVAIGGLRRAGMSPAQIDELWAVLHRANMAKVDPRYGLLNANGGKPYLDARGSIQKPPGFRPIDFEPILRRMKSGATDE